MRLFEKSLQGLDEYVQRRSMFKGMQGGKIFSESVDHFTGDPKLSASIDKPELLIDFKEEDINRYFPPSPLRFSEQKIGEHPDFDYLDHSQTENHYAASLFMDIKGSTRLIDIVSSLEELRMLKDTILTLAIKVCHYFGGHVQRLQGDGIFVLFVRRGHHPNDAIIGALNAASILTYFVKNDLGPAIERMGIERPIQIRTGIDFGESKDVLWSRYGIPGCDELTTTSLHTDMAAKLQQKASANGIMIGDNVKNGLDIEDFYSIRTYAKDGEIKQDRNYSISSHRKYPFWKFEWEKYLLSYSCTEKTVDGITFKMPEKRLQCKRLDNGMLYSENSYALPRDIGLEFIIINRHGEPLNNYPERKIQWKIVNTGSEARSKEMLDLEVTKENNPTSVEVSTAYLGHHKMQCIIGGVFGREILEFRVFVQPDKLLEMNNVA